MDIFERTYAVIWSDWFWLPANTTWADLENKPGGINHPRLTDLLVPFPTALLLYLIRQFYEKYVVTPFATLCGISKEGHRKAPTNDTLENAYRRKKIPDNKEIQGLAKQTDLAVRHVERWFRLRRNQDRPTMIKKFTETGWRFTYYLGIFIYGINVLRHKIWFWDSRYCWRGFPEHDVDGYIFWYYMIELGFYWSLMFSQFLDVKRKDFAEMFIHHIATILLLSFSYINNFVRVGSLVLCIHDCVDYWVEAAKMAKYAKAHLLCDCLFAVFAIVWFVTRLLFYPYKILHTTWFESNAELGFFPSLVFFNGWLCLLMILHIYWFSLIVRVSYAALTKKSEVDDVRSSTEEEVTDDIEDEMKINNHLDNDVSNHVHSNQSG